MQLSTIATLPNLKLAWRRISTGGNYSYKKFFRQASYSYEVSLEENLKDLRVRLLAKSWRPTTPERLYTPKPSGLQRPITLLRIEDQIVLQAIANLLSKKVQPRRRPHILNTVFSNILDSPTSIFFLRDWRRTYRAFQRGVEGHYRAGRRWVLDFDLAAFYETVSHDLLLKTAFPRAHDSEDVQWIGDCLAIWSSADPNSAKGHGLPQGPIASDFLAEVFLLPIDEEMVGLNGYLRYVDDIRLFGTTELELRKIAVALEVRCRERGLIPQVEKYSVRRAVSMRDALGSLPSINDPHRDEPYPRLSRSRGETLLKPALGGKPLKVRDKTRLRYVLFRTETSPKISRTVCTILARHPEHVDAFAAYLARCGYNRRIVEVCLEVLRTTPYEYVQGHMWLLLAKVQDKLRHYRPVDWRGLRLRARATVRDKTASLAIQWGAGEYLCYAERLTGFPHAKSVRFVRSELAQALLAESLPVSALAPSRTGCHWLKSRTPEPGLALVRQMLFHQKKPSDLGVASRQINRTTARTLRAVGLTRARGRRLDVVGEIIERRFGVVSGGEWQRILGAEYGHAAGLATRAESLFDAARSEWLVTQNSFNQTVFLALQRYLAAAGLPGAVTIVDRKGELCHFGVTLDSRKSFSLLHPVVADGFRAVNDRRNRLPGAHPYDKKSGARTKHLAKQERNRFVATLANAYRALLLLAPP